MIPMLMAVFVAGTGFSDAPTPQGPGQQDSWGVQFEEVSEQAGIDFQHAGEVHDPQGEDNYWPGFPEIMGSGACWADFTGDGYEDLYVANQRFNDENPYAQGYNGLFDPTNRLYVNQGDGTFADQTAAAGVESRRHDQGCSAVDYDGDGHVDLLVYGFGHTTLYRNNGDQTFDDVTQGAGLDRSSDCLPFDCWHTCSSWVDYDGDGHLDVFVCTYVDARMDDSTRNPAFYVAQYNALFKNNGDGTFDEVAHQAGVEGVAANALGSKSLGAAWFDADLDGRSDLYVANDMTPNEFYWNNGDGTFTRDDDTGLYDDQAGMGLTSGDATGDGHPDLYFTHYATQHNGFYENLGDGTFKDRSGEDDLAHDWDLVGWGTHLVDLDRNGHMDVVAANGHTEWKIVTGDYDQKTLVVRQQPQGDGTTWVDASNESGPAIREERVTRGAAFADYEMDGNMDMVLVNNANQSLQFLRGSGNTNHWVYVQPVQPGANHQAIGARVVVEAGGVSWTREIQAGSSFMSQNSLLADFGLGEADVVDRITVHWPHGNTTVVEGVPVDHVVRIDRATGSFTTDTLSPTTQAVLSGDGGGQGWYRSAVDVEFPTQDHAVGSPSGVARTDYRYDGGPWTSTGGDPVRLPAEEGEHVLDYRSVDHAGNVEPVQTTPVRMDLSAPGVDHEIEGDMGSNGWWLNAQLILDAADALSGVDRVEWRVDGGSWTVYDGPVGMEDGHHVVEYFATDRAGNPSPVQAVELQVDSVSPDVSFLRPEPGRVYLGDEAVAGTGIGPAVLLAFPDVAGPGGEEYTVRVASRDETSGVDRVALWLDGEPVQQVIGPGPETAWAWNLSSDPAGTHLLEVVARDRAGNVQMADRWVVLVPATPGGLGSTVDEGPSLLPWFEP